MRKVVIFGSCVSRASFDRPDLKPRLAHYHARSNLTSMTRLRPLDPMPEIEMESPFERRCAERDLSKNFEFEQSGAVVIFDFIDDRFPVGSMGGCSFTYNHLMIERNRTAFARAEPFPHYEPGNRGFMRQVVREFADANDALLRNNTIVLHEAKFSTFFDGENPTPDEIASMNAYYDFLFAEIKRVWKVDHVVNLTERVVSPDCTPRDHKWGHAPFHFDDGYNVAFADEIRTIVVS